MGGLFNLEVLTQVINRGTVAAKAMLRTAIGLVGLPQEDKATLDSLKQKTADLNVDTAGTWTLASSSDAEFIMLAEGATQLGQLSGGTVPTGTSGWTNDITTTDSRIALVRMGLSENRRDFRLQFGGDSSTDNVHLDAYTVYATDANYQYIAHPRLAPIAPNQIRLQHHGDGPHTRYVGALPDGHIRLANLNQEVRDNINAQASIGSYFDGLSDPLSEGWLSSVTGKWNATTHTWGIIGSGSGGNNNDRNNPLFRDNDQIQWDRAFSFRYRQTLTHPPGAANNNGAIQVFWGGNAFASNNPPAWLGVLTEGMGFWSTRVRTQASLLDAAYDNWLFFTLYIPGTLTGSPARISNNFISNAASHTTLYNGALRPSLSSPYRRLPTSLFNNTTNGFFIPETAAESDITIVGIGDYLYLYVNNTLYARIDISDLDGFTFGPRFGWLGDGGGTNGNRGLLHEVVVGSPDPINVLPRSNKPYATEEELNEVKTELDEAESDIDSAEARLDTLESEQVSLDTPRRVRRLPLDHKEGDLVYLTEDYDSGHAEDHPIVLQPTVSSDSVNLGQTILTGLNLNIPTDGFLADHDLGAGTWQGVTRSGTYVWVLDNTTDYLRAHNELGLSRVSAKDINLQAGNHVDCDANEDFIFALHSESASYRVKTYNAHTQAEALESTGSVANVTGLAVYDNHSFIIDNANNNAIYHSINANGTITANSARDVALGTGTWANAFAIQDVARNFWLYVLETSNASNDFWRAWHIDTENGTSSRVATRDITLANGDWRGGEITFGNDTLMLIDNANNDLKRYNLTRLTLPAVFDAQRVAAIWIPIGDGATRRGRWHVAYRTTFPPLQGVNRPVPDRFHITTDIENYDAAMVFIEQQTISGNTYEVYAESENTIPTNRIRDIAYYAEQFEEPRYFALHFSHGLGYVLPAGTFAIAEMKEAGLYNVFNQGNGFEEAAIVRKEPVLLFENSTYTTERQTLLGSQQFSDWNMLLFIAGSYNDRAYTVVRRQDWAQTNQRAYVYAGASRIAFFYVSDTQFNLTGVAGSNIFANHSIYGLY